MEMLIFFRIVQMRRRVAISILSGT
jgi:hypothetical protein